MDDITGTDTETIYDDGAGENIDPTDSGLTEADLYSVLRTQRRPYDAAQVAALLAQTDEERVLALADTLKTYITDNLPKAIEKRKHLGHYRTNPYVMLASANVMQLSDMTAFAKFLFDTKLYTGLETSFGKSIEAAFVKHYPIGADKGEWWEDPAEKIAEFAALEAAKLTNEAKARARNNSVWREIDKSCVAGDRRYLVSIKSGPNCINDTQVAGMVNAIATNYPAWVKDSMTNYPGVTGIDIIVGITYGTDLTTNNKENQILAKLQEHGFSEEERATMPGVLVSSTGNVRVYRRIGQDFWALIGCPSAPVKAAFVFLEVLLALTKALADVMESEKLEEKVNKKLKELSQAFLDLQFPADALPDFVKEEFDDTQLTWLAAALTEFFDRESSRKGAVVQPRVSSARRRLT